jgi:hypothetical protein
LSEFGEILRERIVEVETHLTFIAGLEASGPASARRRSTQSRSTS